MKRAPIDATLTVPPRSCWLGDYVLDDVIGAINGHGRWGTTPDVFALVDPNNEPSCELFKRRGFQVVIEADPDNPEADALFGRRGTP